MVKGLRIELRAKTLHSNYDFATESRLALGSFNKTVFQAWLSAREELATPIYLTFCDDCQTNGNIELCSFRYGLFFSLCTEQITLLIFRK